MALQDILQSKKILLFSVSFFNYEKIIAERLKELGADVDFYDERPSNSIFVPCWYTNSLGFLISLFSFTVDIFLYFIYFNFY